MHAQHADRVRSCGRGKKEELSSPRVFAKMALSWQQVAAAESCRQTRVNIQGGRACLVTRLVYQLTRALLSTCCQRASLSTLAMPRGEETNVPCMSIQIHCLLTPPIPFSPSSAQPNILYTTCGHLIPQTLLFSGCNTKMEFFTTMQKLSTVNSSSICFII